jgi:hypothetical protein
MTPQPAADEYPGDYRRRLFKGLLDKLPLGRDLLGLDPNELDTHAIKAFELQLIDATKGEGENPTGSNIPEDLDDPRARRERTDNMGRRFIEWKVKHSLIKDFSRPLLKVLRFIGPSGK